MAAVAQKNEEVKGIGISVPQAAKYGLWGAACALSLLGIAIGIVVIFAGYFALGGFANAISSPMDDANLAIGHASDSVSNFANGGAGVNSSTADIAASLRKFSSGMSSVADKLGALSSMPLIGPNLAGMDSSVADLKASAASANAAAASIEGMNTDTQGGFDSLKAMGDDLRTMQVSVANSKKTVLDSIGLLQIAIIGIGLMLELVTLSCLLLALSYGPPKTIEKAEKKKEESGEEEKKLVE